MKKFGLLTIALLACASAHANTWYHTYLGGIDDGETIRVDWDSLRQESFDGASGVFVNARVKRNYTAARYNVRNQPYYQEITYWYTDCARGRYRLSHISWYDGKDLVIGGASQPVSVHSSDSWNTAQADDPAYDVYHWICWAADIKAEQAKNP